jgi:hypothetical protein
LLPLKDNVQLLMGLPDQELLNIMTISQKRRRMPPMYVILREQAHGMHPPTNMVIVSKYELVEKSPGFFCSVCRNGSLFLHGGAGKIGWLASRCMCYPHRPIAKNHARWRLHVKGGNDVNQ